MNLGNQQQQHQQQQQQQQPSVSQQQHLGGGDMEMKLEIKQEADIKKEIKQEPGVDPGMDVKPTVLKQEQDIKKEIKTESPKPTVSNSGATPKKPQEPKGAHKVTFTPEELRKALEPPLTKMYNQEPEAMPFRTPVDPVALGIPDYFDIIKKPMDMSSIRRNLENGSYKDPWEFVDDVWLMFENAWVYNKKTSKVYKYCTKVSAAALLYA